MRFGRSAAGLAAGVLLTVGSSACAASHPVAARPTATSSGTADLGATARSPIQVHVSLAARRLNSGGSANGVLDLVNDSGKPIVVQACAVDGWYEIGLENDAVKFHAAYSLVGCKPSVVLAPGTNNFHLTLAARYQECTQGAAAPGPAAPPMCDSGGEPPPLPPGSYRTALSIVGLPAGTETPRPIMVTLVPAT